MYMSTMTITEARAQLPELADRVQTGEEVTVTRHGQPVMVIVHPDNLSRRRSSSIWDEMDRMKKSLDEDRSQPLDAGELTIERAEELVRGIRAERDEL